MPTSIQRIATTIDCATGEALPIDKRSLALDALSKLTCQFAHRPDCKELIDVLILTISGQFSVASAFASVRNPESANNSSFFVGTGKFQTKHADELAAWTARHTRFFLENPRPFRVSELPEDLVSADESSILESCGVKLVAPFIHGETFIGVVGLGEKVTRKAFEDSEIELLHTLANTITPFIANSFLFMEIASLNAWYRQILDSVSHGVFIFDQSFCLQGINSAGWKILREFNEQLPEATDLTGTPIAELFPETTFSRWSRYFVGGPGIRRGMTMRKLVAKNEDTERIFNVGLTTTGDTTGAQRSLVVTLDDVTNQKESEQRMFDLEKLAAKGVMASSISHELNNFLALILGGVELAQMAMKKGNIEKTTASLDKLRMNTQKMERFTAGLMDYNRLEARKELADLNALITDVLSFVVVQKKFTRLTISTDLDPAIPEFVMDSDQIAQLLLNLMNNAADAIRDSQKPGGAIKVSSRFENQHVLLEVADNGVGMKPETRDKVFRAHFTTKEDGHGYGLVTCAKILSNHRAEVDVESELGEGSTFKFRFPIAGDDNPGSEEKSGL